ncbi:MAG: hypothetical protein KFW09_03640 [Oscillospiraceae bacterium]|nr:hypothetical protein [Oscillospiraceae bacterium]
MLRKIILPLVVSAAVAFTGGLIVAGTFDGTDSLAEIQTLTDQFNLKADEYIAQVTELKALSDGRGEDVTLLVGKVTELQELKQTLLDRIADLEAGGDKVELDRLKAELEKANLEIDKANTQVADHLVSMTEKLNSDKFTEIVIDERVDVSEIVKPEPVAPPVA